MEPSILTITHPISSSRILRHPNVRECSRRVPKFRDDDGERGRDPKSPPEGGG
jgi:hypothetical protein